MLERTAGVRNHRLVPLATVMRRRDELIALCQLDEIPIEDLPAKLQHRQCPTLGVHRSASELVTLDEVGLRYVPRCAARGRNVFWQVSGGVTLGSSAHLEGVVLAKTAIALGSTASVNGRLLSQTAVTLINNTVVRP